MTDWNRRQWIAGAVGITGLAGIEDFPLVFNANAKGQKRSGSPKAKAPRSKMKITKFKATLVASPDFALLNSWNVHDSHFKRAILEIETDDGYKGISEIGGGSIKNLEVAKEIVLGRDPFEIEYFRRNIKEINSFEIGRASCRERV